MTQQDADLARSPEHKPPPDLVSLLGQRAEHHPDRVALRFIGRSETTLSYGHLHKVCSQLAGNLAQEAAPGERALLLYPNGQQYVQAFLACSYAGLVAVPAYPPLSLQRQQLNRLLSIAKDAAPRLILTETALVQSLSQVQSSLPELAKVRVIATDLPQPDANHNASLPAIASEDLVLLQYTSGSTAQPKGVMISHENLMANERVIQEAFALTENDVVISWLPLFHDMGLIGTLLQSLYAGATAVLMDPLHFLQRPASWLEAISRFRGTVSGGPDFAYQLCARRVNSEQLTGLDLSSWRLAFCGAEPVRAATLEAFADRFAATGFAASAAYPCYGLAEATLLVTGGLPNGGSQISQFDPEQLEKGCVLPLPGGQALVGCGHARGDHHIRICDPKTGQRLRTDRIGEIQVSGPSIANGYWNNPESTKRSFVRHDGKTFLRTGDLGFEHQGELFVTGRLKDLILVRGRNLYPQDIESSVEEAIPVVRKGRTAAFALELDGAGTFGFAAEVVARVQKIIDAKAVCQAILENVAKTHGEAPHVVLLLEPGELPITSSGKLQRAACAQAWSRGHLKTFARYPQA